MPPKSIAKEVLFLIEIKRKNPQVFHEIAGVLERARSSLSREDITLENKKEIEKETVQGVSKILSDNNLHNDSINFAKLYEKLPELKAAIEDSWINDIYDETGTLMDEARYPRHDAEFMSRVVSIGREFDKQRMRSTGSKGGRKSKKGGIRKRRTSKKTRQSKKQRKI